MSSFVRAYRPYTRVYIVRHSKWPVIIWRSMIRSLAITVLVLTIAAARVAISYPMESLADRDALTELTDDEIGSARTRQLISRALNQALTDEIFCAGARLQMAKPRYMARLNLPGGAVSYEWISRVISSLGSLEDHTCFGSGYYKFVVIERGLEEAMLLRVEPLYM